MDGTLYDERDFIAQAYLPISRVISKACKKSPREIFETLVQRWENFGSSYNRIFSEILDEYQVSALEKAEAIEICLEIYRGINPILELNPGISDFLTEIQSQVELFLITDGNPILQRAKFNALQLSDWFGLQMCGFTGDFGPEFTKPSTMILDKLLFSETGQDGNRVLYVGDRACDIEFAKNAGFQFLPADELLKRLN